MANNPFPLGGALTAGASVLGGITSMINQNKAIKAQQEENERTRQFNLNLAKQQNAWNIEQWNRENAYNSPAAMMARYEAAGLNPNLMYSQQNPSAVSPVMTSGAPAESADMSSLKTLPSVGDMVSSTLQNEMMAAQIDKIKSETKGQSEQNRILATQADIADLTKGDVIKLAGLNVQYKGEQIKLTSAQERVATKTVDEIAQNINTSIAQMDDFFASANVKNMDYVRKSLENFNWQKRFDLDCQEVASRIGVNKAQARDLLLMLPLKIANMSENTKLVSKELLNVVQDTVYKKQLTVEQMEKNLQEVLRTKGLELTNEGLVLSNEYQGKVNSWYDFRQTLQSANDIMDIAVKGTSIYTSLKSPGKPNPIGFQYYFNK